MAKWIMAVVAALALAGSASAAFGSVVSSFQTSWGGTGLAWDGSYLWYWGANSGWLFLRVTTTGSVVSSFGYGHYCEPGGATYDGRNLWCAVEANVPPPRFAVIYSYTKAGSELRSFWHWGPGITNTTPGLAYEPGYLWVENYKYYEGGGLIGSFPEPFPIVSDTAWDGRCLWCSSGSGMYRISTSGSVVASFAIPAYAFAITFDGEYLWAQTWVGGRYWTFQYDVGLTGVEPASLGKVKALNR